MSDDYKLRSEESNDAGADPVELRDPVNTDVIFGLTITCILSGGVLLSAWAVPDLVGSVLNAEMVLAAGMAFAAAFLITVSLLPEEDPKALG